MKPNERSFWWDCWAWVGQVWRHWRLGHLGSDEFFGDRLVVHPGRCLGVQLRSGRCHMMQKCWVVLFGVKRYVYIVYHVFSDVSCSAVFYQTDMLVVDVTRWLCPLVACNMQVVGNIWVFQNAWQLTELYLGGNATDLVSVEQIKWRLFGHHFLEGVNWNYKKVMEFNDDLMTTMTIIKTIEQKSLVKNDSMIPRFSFPASGTKVTGSIEGIVSWSEAQVVDLSQTLVTGRLTHRWRGCCRKLRILKLSEPRDVGRNHDFYKKRTVLEGNKWFRLSIYVQPGFDLNIF